jgi:predicted metal-dependent hydrolase
MSQSILISNIPFDMRRSAQRKTLEIKIAREGQLVLAVPHDCPMEVIERAVEEKRLWIYTKLAQKELLFTPPRPKEYVSGETFYYLGRTYRLLVVKTPSDKAIAALRLEGDRFLLRFDERECADQHFANWYISEGTPWLRRRVELWARRIGIAPPSSDIRELGFRWGSCGRKGNLSFHWRTVLLPPRMIDYLIAHELVHLYEPHHTREFWRILERAMPDFFERKRWLAENGARY